MSSISGLELSILAFLTSAMVLLAISVVILWRKVEALAREMARLSDEGSRTQKPADVPTTSTSPEAAVLRDVLSTTRRRDQPGEKRSRKPLLIAVPDLAPSPPESVALPEELVQRFGAIWDLADSGTPIETISRATGHPIGQVELILGLRRTRTAETRG